MIVSAKILIRYAKAHLCLRHEFYVIVALQGFTFEGRSIERTQLYSYMALIMMAAELYEPDSLVYASAYWFIRLQISSCKFVLGKYRSNQINPRPRYVSKGNSKYRYYASRHSKNDKHKSLRVASWREPSTSASFLQLGPECVPHLASSMLACARPYFIPMWKINP